MHNSCIVPAAMCILALAVQAEDCFVGHWDNQGDWHSDASLPDITSASACLARQGVLFFGGSTTRELFEQVVSNLGLSEQVVEQRCDLAQGFGCYDCARGCHSSYYNSTLLPSLQTLVLPVSCTMSALGRHSVNFISDARILYSGADAIGHAQDWEDKSVQLHNVSLHFSWKPEMFSLDDIIMLQSKSRLIQPAAVIVHKGVHDAHDWLEMFQSPHVPQQVFIAELKERASRLQSTLSDLFPVAKLFWRQAYHNHLDDAKGNASQLIAGVVDPIFSESRFYQVPGQDVSKTIPAQHASADGIHQ